MGYRSVHRYARGEVDWFASGLPREGRAVDERWAGDMADRGVPTCGINETVGEVRGRLDHGYEHCVVVNDERVVLGLLTAEALQADSRSTAATVMKAAPRTFRANAAVDDIKEWLQKRAREVALITTPDGRLLGWISEDQLSARAGVSDHQHRESDSSAR